MSCDPKTSGINCPGRTNPKHGTFCFVDPPASTGTRNDITELYHPDKVTVEEFVRIITNEGALKAFVANMNNLDKLPEEQYPEEWIETFAAWMEMN